VDGFRVASTDTGKTPAALEVAVALLLPLSLLLMTLLLAASLLRSLLPLSPLLPLSTVLSFAAEAEAAAAAAAAGLVLAALAAERASKMRLRMSVANPLPSSTPHWSHELMSQMKPCTAVRCSYRLSICPVVNAVSCGKSRLMLGRFPGKVR